MNEDGEMSGWKRREGERWVEGMMLEDEGGKCERVEDVCSKK